MILEMGKIILPVGEIVCKCSFGFMQEIVAKGRTNFKLRIGCNKKAEPNLGVLISLNQGAYGNGKISNSNYL